MGVLKTCFNKISGVPVVDGDHIVGILSEKDILLGMYPTMDDFMASDQHVSLERTGIRLPRRIGFKRARSRDLMTARVHTVSPHEPILRAASAMFLHNIRRIPGRGRRPLG